MSGPKRLSLSSIAGKKLEEHFGDGEVVKATIAGASLEEFSKTWKKGVAYPIPLDWIDFEDTRIKNRKKIEETEVAELAHSIMTKGQQAPILVKFGDKGKLIIAYGWHRSLACRQAGLTTVEGRVTDASDTECRELALIENLIRRQLKPFDEAKAIFDLKSMDQLPISDIAAISEKDEKSIYAILQIFDFPVIVAALEEGRISSLTTARHLAAKARPKNLSEENQRKIIDALASREIRVQDIDYVMDHEDKLEALGAGAIMPSAATPSELGGDGTGKAENQKPAKTPWAVRSYFQKFADGKISFFTPKLSSKTDLRELKKILGENAKFSESLDKIIGSVEKAGKTEKGKGRKK